MQVHPKSKRSHSFYVINAVTSNTRYEKTSRKKKRGGYSLLLRVLCCCSSEPLDYSYYISISIDLSFISDFRRKGEVGQEMSKRSDVRNGAQIAREGGGAHHPHSACKRQKRKYG